MRLIDADALEELFREVISGIAKKPEMTGNLEHMIRASAMVVEMIQDAPTIEPERKTGTWRRRLTDSGFNADWHCSECGWKTSLEEHGYNYCPNCGAEMRGEE